MSVIVKNEKYVTTASIDRPGSMNAINFEVMDKLETLLDELERDTELRLFILTGSGKSFISGGDLKEFHQIKDAEGARMMSNRMLAILERIENLPCWTLAAVNGHAYGGGWEIMLSLDFRIAVSSAKFGFTQGKFYLPPGWGGLTRLSKTIGRELATFWLASQKVITSEIAHQSGLIQDLYEVDQYEENLELLKKQLTLNDRSYIEYMKRGNQQKSADEPGPFSKFWESKEHQNRVNEFLRKKSK
jgi:enoyl-CoA hydratase